MSQSELVNLMDRVDSDEWLTQLETQEHPQELETADACEAFYERISSYVH